MHVGLCTHVYMQVGIRELRNNVATLVRRAANGERVLVTVDGQPIAMLGPIEPVAGELTLDDLVAAGLVRRPARLDRPPAPEAAALPVDVRVARVLADVRGD